MAKFSEMSEDEQKDFLHRAYTRAADCAASDEESPRHHVNAWLAAARGAAEDDEDRNDASHMPDTGGASDAAIKRRPWKYASIPVRIALDKAYATPGKHEASARLALAEAELRMQGFAGDEGMLRELHSYNSRVTNDQHGARMKFAGYDRLK